MSRSCPVLAWVAVLCFLAPSALSAADKKPAAARPHHYATGQAAIEKALAEKVDLDFTDTPLEEVVEYLKNRCKIEVVIDTRALGEVGIETTKPVTKSVHNRPLRSALNLMLKEHGLTWTIQEGVLLVTTPEQADYYMSTKVYDVSDLVVCRGEHDELWDDYDTLTDTIKATLIPTGWDEPSGSMTGVSLGRAKVLIINHTYQVHCQIADLLAQIRDAAKKNPDGQLPRRDKPASPSKNKLLAAEGSPAVSAPAPLPAKEAQPGAGASPPPCCPGVPPGGMMPPGGGMMPGGPKQPPPEEDPFK
jgi:hypothetical protein